MLGLKKALQFYPSLCASLLGKLSHVESFSLQLVRTGYYGRRPERITLATYEI